MSTRQVNDQRGNGLRRFCAVAIISGSAALFAACASTPQPTDEMAVARTAVASAVTVGGTELAPLEMRAAQEKLSGAEKAMTAENYDQAQRLAREAEVDARLAERKSLALKAQRSVEEARESIRVLQQEMLRQAP